DDLKANFGDKVIPLFIPKGGVVGLKFAGVESIFPLAPNASAEAKKIAQAAVEAAVERDEALMTRYLEGEELKPEEIQKALHEAFRAGAVHPVFVTSGEKDLGVEELLTTIADLFPA